MNKSQLRHNLKRRSEDVAWERLRKVQPHLISSQKQNASPNQDLRKRSINVDPKAKVAAGKPLRTGRLAMRASGGMR